MPKRTPKRRRAAQAAKQGDAVIESLELERRKRGLTVRAFCAFLGVVDREYYRWRKGAAISEAYRRQIRQKLEPGYAEALARLTEEYERTGGKGPRWARFEKALKALDEETPPGV